MRPGAIWYDSFRLFHITLYFIDKIPNLHYYWIVPFWPVFDPVCGARYGEELTGLNPKVAWS